MGGKKERKRREGEKRREGKERDGDKGGEVEKGGEREDKKRERPERSCTLLNLLCLSTRHPVSCFSTINHE